MTKEEAIENIKLIRFNAAITNAKSFKDALDMAIEALSRPSLPSDLDEAAEEYAGVTDAFYHQIEIDAFKAGAEWMAGQGETHEAEIIESVPWGGTKWRRCIKVWLDDQFQAKGDKVIVQIRKK